MPSEAVLIPKPLRSSILDAVFYSLMVGLGESYLVAYALALGLDEMKAGLLAVVPMIFGASVQLFANYGVRTLGSRRRWICLCASMQGIALIALAQLPRWKLSPQSLTLTIFVLACFYWAGGLSAGPTWNVWIGKICPPECRLGFFAKRARIAQLFVLIGLVTTGVVLEESRDLPVYMHIFAALFTFAGLMRFVSAYFIYRQDDLGTAADVVEKVKTNVASRGWAVISANPSMLLMVIYLFLVNTAVYVSGPFFGPFMLKQLRLDFIQYTVLISSSFLARVVANDLFVYIAQRRGVKSLLYFGMIGILPVPFLWTLGNDFVFLLFLQIWSGCVWGSHELGVTLFILEKHEEQKRSIVLTMANFFNCIGVFLGGCIGAQILGAGGVSESSYFKVFEASTLMRILPLTVLFMMGSLTIKTKVKFVYSRILSVRPGGMSITKPILYTDSTSDHDK